MAGSREGNRLFLFIEGAVAHYALEGVVGVGLQEALEGLGEPLWRGWLMARLALHCDGYIWEQRAYGSGSAFALWGRGRSWYAAYLSLKGGRWGA